MMRLLATALVAICLATAAIAQGAPGRVIVLDVSGSMTSQDFRGGTQSRWDQALDVLDELLAQLEASGDTTPTAFGQFGAEFRWADVAGQFGRNPDNVPPDHPLCRDVAFPTDFGQLGGAQSRDILRQATAGTPSGMTPIAEALEQALARLERFGAGEIVLISDMEDPNCLAPGQSLCDAISMALDAFRAPTGQMLVEFRVLAIPNATVAEALAECAPTTTFALSTVDPDPAGIVSDLLGGVPVDVRLIAGGGGNLDAGGIAPAGFIVRVFDGAGRVVASGPPGTLRVPRGTYRFEAASDAGAWSVSQQISGPGRETVEIVVEGGRLILEALDAAGAPLDRIDTLTIRRPGGATIAQLSGVDLADELLLGTGDYEVVAEISGAAPADVVVPLVSGELSRAVLRFDAPPGLRDVAIALVYGQPTLDTGQPFRPQVTLIGPGGLRQALGTPANSLSLPPGPYRVEVAAARPHSIAFDVSPGQAPLEVRIDVPPGWFSAQLPAGGGVLELRDANGTGLYSFDGPLVEHSLPDGRYQLVVEPRDGSGPITRTIEIVAGDLVEVDF